MSKFYRILRFYGLRQIGCFLLFLLLQALFASQAYSDTVYNSVSEKNYRFKTLKVENLDKIGGHWATVQDCQGFMWFGGVSGLARFDGYSIQLYRNDPDDPNSLSSNHVRSLFVDRECRLWIATMWGLNQYDPALDAFIHYTSVKEDPNSLSHNNVISISQDRAGDLWVGTSKGLNRFSFESGLFERFFHDPNNSNSLSSDNIEEVLEDSFGMLWIGTEFSGVDRLDPLSKTFKHYDFGHEPSKLTRGTINYLYEDSYNKIWIGTTAGLSRYNRDSDTFTKYEHKPSDPFSIGGNVVQGILEDSNGNMWIACDGGGVNLFDRKKGIFRRFYGGTNEISGLLNDKVRSVYEDRSGGIWFGHFPAGISVLDKTASVFRNYTNNPIDENSLSHNDITSVLETPEGNLWVGTEKGLNYIDRKNTKIERYMHDSQDPKSLPADAVLSLYLDRQDVLYVGTWRGGLSYLEVGAKSFINVFGKGVDTAWSIYEDAHSDLWVGTFKGLRRRRAGTDEFIEYLHDDSVPESLLAGGKVLAILEDVGGNFWLGARGGLNLMNRHKETFKHFQHDPSDPSSLSSGQVNDIYEDTKGRLWIATASGGVSLLNRADNTITSYRMKDGLADDVVGAIIEDEQQMLWFATGGGLSRFNPETEKFKTFTKSHGLPGEVYRSPAALRSKTGELVFGSTSGLTIFDPQDLFVNDEIPAVVFTDFQIFYKSKIPGEADSPLKKSISTTEEIELDFKQSVFSFEFAALNFQLSHKNQYAYMLEGFDTSWNYVGTRRTASYTNLNPGSYIFRVKASNNDGVWNEEGAAISVRILPPLWKTWWAYLIYALLLCSMLFWFIFTQKQKIQYERAKLLHERAVVRRLQQLDKLKDEFLANTSHELRTPLNGIIGLAESLIEGATGKLSKGTLDNLSMIVSSGRRLGRLVNDILDYSKMRNKTMDVHCAPVNIHEIVSTVLELASSLVANKPVNLVNSVNESLPKIYADDDRLHQVLYNLVGNAIKFTQEGRVEVSAKVVGTFMRVSIIDSGIGIQEENLKNIFNVFEQVEGAEDRAYGGTGLGLAVTKKIVELHDGEISVESEPNRGSHFYFTVPVATLEQIEEAKRLNVNLSNSALDLSPIPNKNLRIENNEKLDCKDEDESCLNNEINSNGIHILIVDDDEINRMVIINHIEMEGYTYSEASSGTEALDILDQGHRVDLIILDIMMPRMTGYQVCQVIRESTPAQELPIIFLTAKNQTEDMVKGFEVGGNDFLHKPISKAELLSRIHIHLRLLEVNRNLEQIVQERTEMLHDEHERLKQTQSQLVQSEKMAGLVSLVSGVAHEFNNPLNFSIVSTYHLKNEIIRLSERVMELTDVGLEVEFAEDIRGNLQMLFSHINRMHEGTSRIKALVDNLLSFSKIDDYGVEEVPLLNTLEPCVNTVKTRFANKVNFEMLTSDEVYVEANASELNQAFMNIMVNSCQAIVSKQGSEEQKDIGLINVRVGEEQELAFVEIEDNGCGMDAETLGHMFDPFYTTRPVGEGVGLGLSIAYDIVNRHKGRIESESEINAGTKLTIYLPFHQEGRDERLFQSNSHVN